MLAELWSAVGATVAVVANSDF